ncbi:tripartite tricarboxylate transporter substrate binding protein, partial [Comamonas sp. B-9]
MQRQPFIRTALRTAIGAAALALAASGFAQTYPAKPVRVVIPFPPGGTLDAVGRMLGQKLADQLGQPFVIENKPGASGVIGGETVARAPADGY